MVTDSHHCLKVVILFPSNFVGFSIFNLEVRIHTSSASLHGACTAAIPTPTNLAISSGMSIVASCAPVGSLAPGGDLPVGRFCTFKSSSLIRKKLRNYPCTWVRMTCIGSFASIASFARICSSGKDSESYRSNHPLTEASKATDAPPILPTQPPTLPTQPPPYGS